MLWMMTDGMLPTTYVISSTQQANKTRALEGQCGSAINCKAANNAGMQYVHDATQLSPFGLSPSGASVFWISGLSRSRACFPLGGGPRGLIIPL